MVRWGKAGGPPGQAGARDPDLLLSSVVAPELERGAERAGGAGAIG